MTEIIDLVTQDLDEAERSGDYIIVLGFDNETGRNIPAKQLDELKRSFYGDAVSILHAKNGSLIIALGKRHAIALTAKSQLIPPQDELRVVEDTFMQRVREMLPGIESTPRYMNEVRTWI